MRVFFSMKDAVRCESNEISHHLLKRKESIALCYSAEVLAILVSIGVEDKSSELVHTLRVRYLRMFLEVSVNDAGETVIIVSLIFILSLGKMNL